MDNMEHPAVDLDTSWRYVTIIEKRLLEAVNSHAPTFEEVDSLINQMRIACENVMFADFSYATRVNCEKHLWDCHTAINSRYRKLVEAYKKGDLKKNIVERRKLEKRYADFIKTAQYFYKGFIQRLASQYKTNFGLRRIANRLSLEMLSVDEQIPTGPVLDNNLELSCYNTLLRLGDLSRYRNNLRTNNRSWAAAVAYYRLAHDLRPNLGSAHNQLAVVAILEGDHLDAVYNIYRAFTAIEPLKDKETNLEVEFNKIITSFEKGRHASQLKIDSMGTLVGWFTLLHAKFYQGVDFPTHKELENEVLTRMTLLLKDQNQKFGDTLEKFVLINISAEYLAASKIGGDSPDKMTSKSFKSFVFALTFNIRFMHAMLEVIIPELEDLAVGDDIPNSTQKSRERITVTCRRVLPALRQYSVWILTRYTHLLNFAFGEQFRPFVVAMWRSHAAVLTKLLDYFNGFDLKSSAYLLEEDEITVGYKPFSSTAIPMECRMHTDADGIVKPRITDLGVKRNHPNIEMQSRVHDILIIGYKLQENDVYPLQFSPSTGTFVFDEASLASILVPSPRFSTSSSKQATPSPSFSNFPAPIHEILADKARVAPSQNSRGHTPESQDSWESQMQSMVQSLVEGKISERSRYTPSNESSYGMHSQTVQDVFGELGSRCAHPQVVQPTSKQLPSLPGFDGAFAPKPNEITPFNPDRPSYATPEQREVAARELERITGYRNYPAWNAPLPLVSQPRLFSSNPISSSSSDFTSSNFDTSTPTHIRNLPQNTSWSRNNNNSTIYPGATDLDFDAESRLRSSPWTNGRPGFGTPYSQTPPGAQRSQGD